MEDKCSYPNCSYKKNSKSSFCNFHAPLEEKDIDQQQFREELRKHKIDEGDLIFKGYIFPISFSFLRKGLNESREITFIDCTFEGEDNLDFYQVHFQKSVKLIKCKFLGKVNFNQTRFRQIDIINCIFQNRIFLDEARFQNGLLVEDCIFEENLDISSIILYKNMEFHSLNVIFKKDVLINKNEIHFPITLDKCEIKGTLKLESSTFHKKINIISSQIEALFAAQSKFPSLSIKHSIFVAMLIIECEFSANINITASDYENLQISFSLFSMQFVIVGNIKSPYPDKTVNSKNNIMINECSFSQDFYIERKTLNILYIVESIFEGNTGFNDLRIMNISNIERCSLPLKGRFDFKNITIAESGSILFNSIIFQSYRTEFSNISIYVSPRAGLVFRHCDLSDVFFTNTHLSYVSFYKSSFDKARFLSNVWQDKMEKLFPLVNYSRKYIIFEEMVLNYSNKQEEEFTEKLDLNNLTNTDVENLYRRYKTALDNSKDYDQAGWFYFNEYEIKRRYASGGKKALYYLYKLFAGYGEKPLWSFTWLIATILLFTTLNLFNGFNFGINSVNYDLAANLKFFINTNFWEDIFISFFYTISRILPLGYFKFGLEDIAPIDTWGKILSIITTITLIFFLTLTGIGLKRLFRRF